MKQTGYDMLYLTACALNGIRPKPDKTAAINLEKLYQMCQFHSLTAIVCMALESSGISDQKFIEAKSKAIRKNILLDAEREKICMFLEENGIWHIALKGAVLKEIYPKFGMRQMADNDILYDKSYQNQVLKYMKNCGYTAESVGKYHHDTYMKPPVYNFELHTSLFGKNNDDLFDYYFDVKSRLVKDDEKKYGYHFTDEDFYVYMTAHEYKHYSSGGTGLRSLLDCFVYVREKSNSINWNYIGQQLKALGIADFERKSRRLSEKIFSNHEHTELSESETEMLEYFLFSGTYGTESNAIKHRVKKMKAKSKSSYIFKRIFPDKQFYQMNFPTAAKYPVLIPFLWCFRCVRAVTVRRKKYARELSIINKITEKELLS